MAAFLAHCPTRLAALLGLLALAGCATTESTAPRDPDPTVVELDRLLARGAGSDDSGRCLAQLMRRRLCPAATSPRRVISVRVALDPRYRRWPNWQERLSGTFACANQLYAGTGVQWRMADILDWDPGVARHDLFTLLRRVQRELPGNTQSLRLGITVWEPRQIFRKAGGEIGLSQAGACVVPSWPRIENDCVILAHELGHLIGARHVPGKQWIMGWAARPFHLPATDPIARVVATYRFHPRNLAAIQAYGQAPVTPRGLWPTLACREHVRQLDRCYGL